MRNEKWKCEGCTQIAVSNRSLHSAHGNVRFWYQNLTININGCSTRKAKNQIRDSDLD